MHYLDHAATTPVRPEVLEAMRPYLTTEFGNPSSQHELGERAAAALDDARRRVAAVLGMRRGDIVFTSGGTESNNLAVKGITIAAQLDRGAAHLITTPIEHESVLASAEYLTRVHGVAVTMLPVDECGRVAADDVAAALRPETALVAIGWANNEVGTVQDLAAIAAAINAAVAASVTDSGTASISTSVEPTQARGAPRGRTGSSRPALHIDAVQAAGWLPLDAGAAIADSIAIAGHKIGAPGGTGVLGVRGRIPLEPLHHGGGQERGRRSGTESVANAVAMATALELAEAEREAAVGRVAGASRAFIERVLARIPEARLTGGPVERLPGTVSFTFAGISGEAILLGLERRGIVSSSGSACAAGRDEPSHVLLALGIAPEVAQTSVRFTLPRSLDVPLEPVADALVAAVGTLRG